MFADATAEWNRKFAPFWLFRAPGGGSLDICLSDAMEERNFSTRLALVAWSRRYSLHLLCLLQNFAHLRVELCLLEGLFSGVWITDVKRVVQTSRKDNVLSNVGTFRLFPLSFNITWTELTTIAVFPSTSFGILHEKTLDGNAKMSINTNNMRSVEADPFFFIH